MNSHTMRWIVCAVLMLGALYSPAQKAGEENTLSFNLDQVDVREFVKFIGRATNKRISIDAKVEGQITVVSPKDVPVSEAFSLFVSILESVGSSVVEDERGGYRVVVMQPRDTEIGHIIAHGDEMPKEGVVTAVMRLKYAEASELQKVLQPLVRGGKKGAIGIIESTNYMIVTDTAENIRRFKKIVAEVDQEDESTITELITLKFATASDVEQQLNKAITAASGSARVSSRFLRRSSSATKSAGLSRRPAVIVSAPHSNALIVAGPVAQVAEIKRIVSLMDVDSPSGRGRLRAVFLKYIDAKDAAKSINGLLAKKSTGTARGRVSTKARVSIEPHVANNALLIDAMPRDFEMVSELIKDLDRPPEQVLIQVVIAEVSMNDQLDIGIDLIAADPPTEAGEITVSGAMTANEQTKDLMGAITRGLFPGGITIGIAAATERSDGTLSVGAPFMANIEAMRRNGKFDILSNVPLLAQNNKEASVSIVNNIPITKSKVQGLGDGREVVQNIDRIDVGIKLKLTPHVNPGGEVTMALNPSIEAIIDPGPTGDRLAPIIARREVNTVVTVPDGQTIVLSGLIREDHTEVVRRVPILGSIPLLGILFRRTVKTTEKTNLIIFVTPTIVTDHAKSKRVTEQWSRLGPAGATNVVRRASADTRKPRDDR